MAKTELTKKLERDLYFATEKQGVFRCFEVTIGFRGKQRCDFMTYDTNGIWRCYEIKISKSDFRSKAKNTFVGHYNYYCMPEELYEQVKDEIPNHIGVVCVYSYKLYKSNNKMGYAVKTIKNPKKQKLKTNEQILKDSLIRSLSRDVEKWMKN
jgi:hypothetical protein